MSKKCECPVCHGEGVWVFKLFGILPMKWRCTNCHGRGYFNVPDGKEICHFCNGSGKKMVTSEIGVIIDQPCEACHGTGFVKEEKHK